jgi:hypothetical protein
MLVEVYLATFAGLLSVALLSVVCFADRYEREPVELIQNSFLSGLFGQLVLILALSAIDTDIYWSGTWLFLTVSLAAVYLSHQLYRHTEMDERFDGIVYSVALIAGAVCVIHVHNISQLISASPYRDAVASGVKPDLRDLLIFATTTGFKTELGHELVLVLTAVFVGGAIGILQTRGWSPLRLALFCLLIADSIAGIDYLSGGSWMFRTPLLIAALTFGFLIKRRSVFKNRPEPNERDLVVQGVKTVLIIFGAVLLTTVLLAVRSNRSSARDASPANLESVPLSETREAS